MVSQDGSAAICARIESDKPAGNKGAGWIHSLTEDRKPISLPSKPPTKELPIASIETRDSVYRALLSELGLSDTHLENLLKRGLTLEQIGKLQYRTMTTEGRSAIVQRLRDKSLKLAGAPGFFLDNGDVRLWGSPGLLIPVRDVQGRIQAMQIRVDHADDGGKYRWLSSSGKPYGCSCGVPVHVARPVGADPSEIWVTEGGLKADIASLKLHRIVLAVAGVGNWHGAIPIVRELKPERVVVAYDSDKTTNRAVRLYEVELTRALLRLDVRVYEANWTQFKGLDDVLVAGGHEI